MSTFSIGSHAEGPLQRPSMRRKSSAQNLLSSFKSNPGPGPASLTVATTANALLPASYATTPTPTSGSYQREWDTQSLHSAIDAISIAGSSSPAIPQGMSVEYLRDLVQKRIITLTYIRNIHEGRSHWFHTILMTRAELDRLFNNNDMKKRTYRFAVLGMSLANLLDINHPHDLLRGLNNTLTEYDQTKEDGEKAKIRLFRPKTTKRQAAGGFQEYASLHADVSEASYLISLHMPYPLDYHETLLSLLDVMSEVYNKICKILGPSPFPHSSQHMMGPLGLLSPHPGVSYLFSGGDHPPQGEGEGSLWGIANASGVSVAGAAAPGGNPLLSWTPALSDMLTKADGKLKKITSTLLKELDSCARNGIKDELASLDPLLRNVAITDDGRDQLDFDGM